MHPFDYVMTLMSFVYALAIAHLLATVGDMIAAGHRVRFSWLNTAWMVYALLAVLVWWVNMWDLRAQPAWNMGLLAIFFVMSSILYLDVRLVCLRVPPGGIVDVAAFHQESGWKYMAGFAVITGFTELLNVFYWQHRGFLADLRNPVDWAVFIQCVAAILGARFPARSVQVAAAVTVGLVWAWFLYFLQGGLFS